MNAKLLLPKSFRIIFVMGAFLSLPFLQSCENIANDDTTEVIDKITGTWNASSNVLTKLSFQCQISSDDPESGKIYIYNFDACGNNAYIEATVTGETIIFPEQTIDGITYKQGSGVISNNYKLIDFVFKADNGDGIFEDKEMRLTR